MLGYHYLRNKDHIAHLSHTVPQLEECGIDVVSKLERTLTREDASAFYEQHQGQDFFLQLIDYMTRFLWIRSIYISENFFNHMQTLSLFKDTF